MKLTCAQKQLLRESKCPGCGNLDAYQSFRRDWECPESTCKFFSQRRQQEVSGQQPGPAGPTIQDFEKIKQLAEEKATQNSQGAGIKNIWTKVNDTYAVSTAYNTKGWVLGHPGLEKWETMVFKSGREFGRELSGSATEALETHLKFMEEYSKIN